MKRKFAELSKATAKGDVKPDYTIAAEATKRISEIFHLDGQLKDLSKSDREKERQRIVKPKVDDFFEWVKAALPKVPADGAPHKGLNYCINQEAYLRVYNYLELLLEEIPKHSEEETDYLQDLMPWSDYVQEKCHTLKKPQTVDQYYIP